MEEVNAIVSSFVSREISFRLDSFIHSFFWMNEWIAGCFLHAAEHSGQNKEADPHFAGQGGSDDFV